MPRCKKIRMVEFIPENKYFIPVNVVGKTIEEAVINVEEVEAVRLSDLEGFEQDECAEKMNISRATFQRVINSARKKISDALVNGKAIRIEGGSFTRNICTVTCPNCGGQWEDVYENFANEKKLCPKCNRNNLECHPKGEFCKGYCKRYGMSW